MAEIKLLLDRHFPYAITAFSVKPFQTKQVLVGKLTFKPIADFLHILQLYRGAYEADVILGNRRSVLLLGLAFYLYKPKNVIVIGYEIVLNFKNTLRHKVSKIFWRLAVRKIDLLITQTYEEVPYLAKLMHTSELKFHTIHFFSENHEYSGPTEKGYIFAAGRMERDFVTLLKALRGSNQQLVIVAGYTQRNELERYKTSFTQIYYDIPQAQYLSLLKEARLVVMCMKDGITSRGHVVLLQAMSMGKPIICSKILGIKEYLKDKESAWMVEVGSHESLRKAIMKCLSDHQLLQKLAKNAYHVQQKSFSQDIFSQHYRQLIINIYQNKHSNYHDTPDDFFIPNTLFKF